MELTTASRETTDKRLLRGAKNRHLIARHAVDIASVDGLEGLSIGKLATDLGMSKSGVQALFKTKERLQLSTVMEARQAFDAAVITPVLAVPAGAKRLRALAESWLDYARTPLFAGGCFWAANLAAFAGRPGPVGTALINDSVDWQGFIASELEIAIRNEEIRNQNSEAAAFQIDAVFLLANSYFRAGQPEKIDVVYSILDQVLGPTN